MRRVFELFGVRRLGCSAQGVDAFVRLFEETIDNACDDVGLAGLL